jgi:hypothetical protein
MWLCTSTPVPSVSLVMLAPTTTPEPAANIARRLFAGGCNRKLHPEIGATLLARFIEGRPYPDSYAASLEPQHTQHIENIAHGSDRF